MKRLPAIFSFLACLCYAGKVLGCPLEGPNMPNAGFWKTGIQTNVTFGADMENIKGTLESKQLFATASYGIADYLSFDGKAGTGDVTFDISDSEKIENSAGFAGGYGGRILLHRDAENGINCILGLHHISVHPTDTRVNDVKYEAIMDEWQASLLLSKRISSLTPYIAGKFSKIFLIRKVNDVREWVTPENEWGLIVGSDVDINENVRFNVEGRFFDEEALTAGFNYTF